MSLFKEVIGNVWKYHDGECSSTFSNDFVPVPQLVEAGLCFLDVSKVYTSDSEARPNGTCLAGSFEAHENRLTLAMPIGEAASDIAGAILKLDL